MLLYKKRIILVIIQADDAAGKKPLDTRLQRRHCLAETIAINNLTQQSIKHPVGQTRNGVLVHVDLIASPAAVHISRQPHLLGLVSEALAQMAARDIEVTLEFDMGRIIGYDFIVPTTDRDNVLYAQRPRDTTYTRFVKNGDPAPTQFLTIKLRREDSGEYSLHDTWIGHASPPRPGSDNETAESKPYWATHACIFEGQSLQPRTITKVCPY